MYYFNRLPKIITPDQNGYPILMTNLMARASMVQELLNNPMNFYEYAIQEGDTPEIVAEKYYGDPFMYWIVMFSNQILDPIWDWPMSYKSLMEYIDLKYATEAADAGKTPYEYVNTTVYQYQKIIKTTEVYTGTETINEVSMTVGDYNALTDSVTTYSIPGGTSCIVSITKNIITLFNYEENLNESRRQIKLMNKDYAGSMDNQLYELMKVA
jgi:hypothetical protein